MILKARGHETIKNFSDRGWPEEPILLNFSHFQSYFLFIFFRTINFPFIIQFYTKSVGRSRKYFPFCEID